MNSFAELLDRGLYELRYIVPTELLTKQLGYSLSQFCRDSGAFHEEVTVASFVDGDPIASNVADAVISSIRNVKVNGRYLSKSEYSFKESYSQLFISPSVGAVGKEVILDVITVPPESYVDYPASFYSAYGQGIVAHACFELSIDESEPWARAARMPVFKKTYDNVVSQARRRNFKPFSLSV